MFLQAAIEEWSDGQCSGWAAEGRFGGRVGWWGAARLRAVRAAQAAVVPELASAAACRRGPAVT
jgi:hypothetical protein